MPLARELQSQFSAQAVAGIQGSTAQTFTAAGTSQATAAAISAQFTNISTAGAAGAPFAGAILPSGAQPGDEFDVVNTTAVNVCVYPQSAGKINNNTVNIPLCMAVGKMHRFQSIDGTNWAVDSI